MNEQDKIQLLQSLSEVLENLAFMFVDEPMGCDLNQYGSFFHASIGFRRHVSSSEGGLEGRFEIIAPTEFAVEMAGNILGAEVDGMESDLGYSAMLELANVICGHVLAQRYGTDSVFDLDIPSGQTIEIEDACERFGNDDRYSIVNVEETPICMSFWTQS